MKTGSRIGFAIVAGASLALLAGCASGQAATADPTGDTETQVATMERMAPQCPAFEGVNWARTANQNQWMFADSGDPDDRAENDRLRENAVTGADVRLRYRENFGGVGPSDRMETIFERRDGEWTATLNVIHSYTQAAVAQNMQSAVSGENAVEIGCGWPSFEQALTVPDEVAAELDALLADQCLPYEPRGYRENRFVLDSDDPRMLLRPAAPDSGSESLSIETAEDIRHHAIIGGAYGETRSDGGAHFVFVRIMQALRPYSRAAFDPPPPFRIRLRLGEGGRYPAGAQEACALAIERGVAGENPVFTPADFQTAE